MGWAPLDGPLLGGEAEGLLPALLSSQCRVAGLSHSTGLQATAGGALHVGMSPGPQPLGLLLPLPAFPPGLGCHAVSFPTSLHLHVGRWLSFLVV